MAPGEHGSPSGTQMPPCDAPPRPGTFILLHAKTRSSNRCDSSAGKSTWGLRATALACASGGQECPAGPCWHPGGEENILTVWPGQYEREELCWTSGRAAGEIRAASGSGKPLLSHLHPCLAPTPTSALTPTSATPVTGSFLVTQNAGKKKPLTACLFLCLSITLCFMAALERR